MRIVVVGAGVIGMLTAVECVRAGAQVDLVDQADIPSASATSYDRCRVVRTLHRGSPTLTMAAAHLHEDWSAMERLLGSRFYHPSGALTLMAADTGGNLAMLIEAGASVQVLSAEDISLRCPHIRFEDGTKAVFEPAAGAVLADRALLAAARWLRDQPTVRMHRNSPVTEVDGSGEVRLADGTVLTGDSVVVAAGPWSGGLLPAGLVMGLTLMRQTMLTYAATSSQAGWWGSPAVLGLGDERDAWLMPPVLGASARLSAASACRAVPEMTDHETPREWLDHLTDRFSALLTDFDAGAVTGATDAYYLTDEHGEGPLLAELGDAVWAYAACGGMSFKFAPAVARALAGRAVGRTPQPTGLDAVDQPRRFAAAHLRRRSS
ncbi:glycine/D-amino acid oxidase-like deaminating enzyme [Kibdelosporangium banguiense]|uniref:Glycine/D-amino acid oxidase-like deaminating enzyme n=1 Tax=Kibdelosporangium banguiense TaxID=1365924 RepID=A0ABS4TPZ7_9PSEU|nr:FAD-dependent oxidoreductase [Kibdelosporangium banguiense]MBP2326481.1 glycine/D-amino acid oxidase-like deaminating enzyme [Kibdelosporangium banguiense]